MDIYVSIYADFTVVAQSYFCKFSMRAQLQTCNILPVDLGLLFFFISAISDISLSLLFIPIFRTEPGQGAHSNLFTFPF